MTNDLISFGVWMLVIGPLLTGVVWATVRTPFELQ